MKKILLIVFCLVCTGSLEAQIVQVNRHTTSPSQYSKVDWDIFLTGEWKNPYLEEDIALDMEITDPKGRRKRLPCFYETGESGRLSLWKARFTPQEGGKYLYHFVLRKGLNGIDTSKIDSFKVAIDKEKRGFLHSENNWIFRFDNGEPFRGLGENIGWESRTIDDSKHFKELHENPRFNYDYMIPDLKDKGGNFFRTWVCRWNLPLDWKNGFNNWRYRQDGNYYNQSAIERMDWLVDAAELNNVYFMLTLGSGDYGRRGVRSIHEFFKDPEAKEIYRNRLRYIIARWGYSTHIGVFEFFNEVDNIIYSDPENPINLEDVVNWHREMSQYLKNLDPYGHLISTSISHRDIPGLNTIQDVDFNQKHIYRNTSGIPGTIIGYEKKFNKPYVIGEFSYEWDWTKDFDLFRDSMISDFKRGLWYGLFSPTPILPMSWWWEYFDDLGTDSYFEQVSNILGLMMKEGDGHFEKTQFKVADPSVVTLSLKAGEKYFVYLYNPNETEKEVTIELPDGLDEDIMPVGLYDCETGRFMTEKPASNVFQLKESINLRLKPQSDIVLILK